jgi:hypothetical protein
MNVAPFKAGIIPWRVRAPLYQEMIERTEYAREMRIKRNAEISLSLTINLVKILLILRSLTVLL